MTKPSSSSHPQSSNPKDSSPASHSLLEGIQSLQHSVTTLLNHVRYLEHGLKMVMPPALHEEFESDKIIFGIDSDSEEQIEPAHAFSSASDPASSSQSPSPPNDDSEGNAPLIQHFKK